MKTRKKTILEIEIPGKNALGVNWFLINSKNPLKKWEEYKINVFIVGFVDEKGDRVFQPECYTANNLPTGIVKYFILEVSSLEETTNEQILEQFVSENFPKIKSA